MNKNESISRTDAERKENLEEVKNDVPGNRMQSEQQVANVMDAKADTPNTGFQKRKSEAKGETLKQTQISDMITGSVGNSGIGLNAAGRSVSGTVGGILGANNSTPQAGQSRSDSRPGKKLDRIATKLNYTPCEQVLLAVDESKPLADSSNEDQGYNGTYRNEDARSQKIMGAVPADLMFQRSVDFISKDQLYFAEGQMVFQSGDSRTAYDPSKVYDPEKKDYVNVSIHTGDYLHRAVHFGLTEQGKVDYVFFDVEDITPDAVSADDANVASAHRKIKANVAEIDRMIMDEKAGDEKADIWTPLARAMKEPTLWSYLMSSIEGDTGTLATLAYSKCATNFAFQLNRAAKDGLDTTTPAIEQCVGWRSYDEDSKELANAYDNSLHGTVHKIFDKANYRKGDPSLLIDVYDSISKYNSKADLLLQPRGWRMHLQTADNNINALKVYKQFVNVFNGNETFSTIDREYDPLLPICFTDKANVILSHNLNELAGFCNNFGYKEASFVYSCTKTSDEYNHNEVKILRANAGLPWKGLGYGDHIYLYYKKTSGHTLTFNGSTGVIRLTAGSSNVTKATVEVKISSKSSLDGYTAITYTKDGQTISTFEDYGKDIVLYVPVNQNTDDNVITDAKLTINTDDKLFAPGCRPLKYMYSDLRNNYVVSVDHPFVFGMIDWLEESVGTKIRGKIDQEDFFIPLIFSTQNMTLAQLAICASTPWIQRRRINSMKDVIYYEDNVKEYPYSKLVSIKDTPFKNFVNFGFTDYDHPLETKVMNPVQAIRWIMPEFFWKIGSKKYVLPWYFNECDLNSDGTVNDDANTMSMPSIRSGIRLGFMDTLYSMSEKDIRLGLDRMTKTFLRNTDFSAKYAYKYGRTTDGQVVVVLNSADYITIGDILKAPRELGLVMDAPLGVLTIDPTRSNAGTFEELYSPLSYSGEATSYRIRCYTNKNTAKNPSILDSDGVNITRASNYVQRWFELTCSAKTSGTMIAGLVFGMNDDDASYQPIASLSDGSQEDISVSITSFMRSVNTRLQFLPFVISPFDAVPNSSKNHDIYDFCYFFGLAGFRASDYRESVYNRSKEVINQGFLFTDDPWVNDSPIMKGASKSTGVKITKGYTI